ncbi:efflux RND transporter periplasmic adaptor subunit [Dyella flava]|uniref:HlyD family secretion protein n=1 Tax=Dyella flava TaxID=1920170 RepID=A0ABS2K1D5_9GAMM|nr:HlyD family secretion protein [Dyella flava]MBM7124929.1 HlyD family secretion protein [Dyella flava]GLQ49883.1 membrane protein [Dyella flava]
MGNLFSNHRLSSLARSLFTLLAIGTLLYFTRALWVRYQVDPVTRDGKVVADIVPVSTDVAGLIVQVCVKDNQYVKKGQVLLVVDPSRYLIALRQAQANLGGLQADLTEAVREYQRSLSMPDVVATELTQQEQTRVEHLRMAVADAAAALDLAKLNLDRTKLRAPVDGKVTDMTLQPDIYLTTGKPAFALVDVPSMRVEGYFEETKLQKIHVNDPVSIHLMGVPEELHGHVESIAGAIEDRERTGDMAKLAGVDPVFTWVRLAQRIPVRIKLDHVPPDVLLVPGQTATVVVQPAKMPWGVFLW